MVFKHIFCFFILKNRKLLSNKSLNTSVSSSYVATHNNREEKETILIVDLKIIRK